jgi:Ran GTPase-activating protein (RanGAP) involved in mRNA processing and transport
VVANAGLLRVSSSLNQLEFLVPPSRLSQRLGGVCPEQKQDENVDEDEMGLIFRTMSPVGARSRLHVDLGHFSHMRPSEHPQLGAHSTLHSLNLADSLLTAQALASILESLTRHKRAFDHLRKIDLSGNKIGDDGVRLLSDVLSAGCPRLEDISLRGNQVTDAGAAELLQAILEGGGELSLHKIDLGDNKLTLGLPRLTELLTHLPCLRVLDLSWNTITLVTFAEKTTARNLLEKCRDLRVLSLAYNRMGDPGVAVILKAMEDSPTLQLVDLAYCFCSEKVAPALLSLLQRSHGSAGVVLLMLHGVALPLSTTEEVMTAAASGGRRLILEGHHTGISINMKYRME